MYGSMRQAVLEWDPNEDDTIFNTWNKSGYGKMSCIKTFGPFHLCLLAPGMQGYPVPPLAPAAPPKQLHVSIILHAVDM